eukprot:2569680-Pyramimonas_sp.AAC.1
MKTPLPGPCGRPPLSPSKRRAPSLDALPEIRAWEVSRAARFCRWSGPAAISVMDLVGPTTAEETLGLWLWSSLFTERVPLLANVRNKRHLFASMQSIVDPPGRIQA